MPFPPRPVNCRHPCSQCGCDFCHYPFDHAELGQFPHLCDVCEDTEVLLKRTSDLTSEGWRRDFRAFVADIHEPLGSAAEVSESHDSIPWHDRGALLSGQGPTAVGLRKEYWRLKQMHRDCHEIPPCQEGQLWNFYLKCRGALTKLSSLELNAQDEGGAAVDAGAGRSSGNPRPAEQP